MSVAVRTSRMFSEEWQSSDTWRKKERRNIPKPTLTPIPIQFIPIERPQRTLETLPPSLHIPPGIQYNLRLRVRSDQLPRKSRRRQIRHPNTTTQHDIEILPGNFQPVRIGIGTSGCWFEVLLGGQFVPFFQAVGREDRVVAVPGVFDSERVQGVAEGFGAGAGDSYG